eukprot:326457-Prymnesium_polylepis.1
MQGGEGLRRAAPCASRVGTGRGRVAEGPGGGPGGAAAKGVQWRAPDRQHEEQKARQKRAAREERGRAQERPRVR